MRKTFNHNIKIGKKLQFARLSAGYTQEEVAEKLDCSSRYIGQLETNRSSGSINIIIQLCNLYNISLNDLYGEYLTNSGGNHSSSLGFSNLNQEHQLIIENTIEFLLSLEKKGNKNQ